MNKRIIISVLFIIILSISSAAYAGDLDLSDEILTDEIDMSDQIQAEDVNISDQDPAEDPDQITEEEASPDQYESEPDPSVIDPDHDMTDTIISGTSRKSALRKITDGKSYYLIYKNGTHYTGWYTFESGRRVYCDPKMKGAFATGLNTIDGKKYLFTKRGFLCVGKVFTFNGKKYLANAKGALKSGWYRLNERYRMYFSPSDYTAVKGLVTIGSNRYIFDDKGRNKTSAGLRKYNGKRYYSRSTGSLKTGWVRTSAFTMYFDYNTYEAKTGLNKIDGKYYLFKKNGIMFSTAGTPVYRGSKYWVSSDGSLKSGWLDLGGVRLYFRPDTLTAYVNTTVTFGSQRYTFDSNGAVSAEWTLFWKANFGITREALIAYLNANINSIIGTPYGGEAEDTPIPGVQMQCTGFVWYALNAVASYNNNRIPCSDMRRCSQYYSPGWDESLCSFGMGRLFDGHADYLLATGQKYIFTDKFSMLSSGILEKGDIIWIAGSDDTHVGFFWGDTPSEDKFWHSKYYGNEVTHVYYGGPTGNRISGIEACGTPMYNGYFVLKLD